MNNTIKHWDIARECYEYPFDLTAFHRRNEFSENFFTIKSDGNRKSTIDFEKYYQNNAKAHIEVYIEVLFWKLYSKRSRDTKTFDSNGWYNQAITTLKNSSSVVFWDDISNFHQNFSVGNFTECKKNYRQIARKMFINNKLIIPLTFVALAYPNFFPMIDTVVISWIDKRIPDHNRNRKNHLKKFSDAYQPTIDTDFDSYIQWVRWCQESASILNEISKYSDWRPRDVEMAIFTYQRMNLGDQLEILE